jgi:hypothetical protein
MPTTIKLKNSVTTTNAPSSLVQGEVAINITDKKVWVGNAATTPIQLLGDGGSASFTSIAFGAGTVSNPSITFTGDTNTGIYSPAADTIAFTEGGAEAMRIDSSGNVGIGTSSPSNRLSVVGGNVLVNQTNATIAVVGGDNTNLQQVRVRMSGTDGILDVTRNSGTSPNLLFGTEGTERMRIDSSGNVGIGTSSPNNLLHVSQASSDFQIRVTGTSAANAGSIRTYNAGGEAAGLGTTGSTNSGYGANLGFMGTITNIPQIFLTNNTERMRIAASGDVGIGNINPQAKLHVGSVTTAPGFGTASEMVYISGTNQPEFLVRQTTNSVVCSIAADATGGFVRVGTNHPLLFYTNNSERMRITSGGDLLVGTSTGQTSRIVTQADGTSTYGMTSNMTAVSGTRYHIVFRENGTERGSVTSNGSATSYNTSSDYRLKENIAPMSGALETVAQLKPVTYNWKVDGSAGQGFIAHELQEVVPDAVTGEKDAVDAEGNPRYQGIDTSFLVATLTAAIQEQQAIINDLQTRIIKLENK